MKTDSRHLKGMLIRLPLAARRFLVGWASAVRCLAVCLVGSTVYHATLASRTSCPWYAVDKNNNVKTIE